VGLCLLGDNVPNILQFYVFYDLDFYLVSMAKRIVINLCPSLRLLLIISWQIFRNSRVLVFLRVLGEILGSHGQKEPGILPPQNPHRPRALPRSRGLHRHHSTSRSLSLRWPHCPVERGERRPALRPSPPCHLQRPAGSPGAHQRGRGAKRVDRGLPAGRGCHRPRRPAELDLPR
jgi:hypothetical protein